MNAVAQKRQRIAAACKRAAIYVRQSLDRDGDRLGVERQEEDCRAYVLARGWDVAEVYSDNDKSATSGKPRPEWERLLADVAAGHIDAIVVWHIDRLTRQPRELEDVIDLADRHGLALGTVTGEVDLATPTGRMVARIVGSTARYEAEHKGERQRRQRRQAAEAGKPHMGGPRPYGYLPDRVTLHPDEAPVVAEAAQRVLAGESMRSVVGDFNTRGLRTTTGKHWTPSAFKTILKSARISGRREVFTNGTKVLGEVVAVDCWEAIVTPEQSDRLRVLLASRGAAPGRRAGKHLLSGLLRCSRCGSKMTAMSWERGNMHQYRCPSNGASNSQTCGRLSVLMKHAEPVVRNLLLDALDSPDFHERLHARAEVDPALVEAVRKDEQRLLDLAGFMAAGDMTMAEWKTARDVVQARLEVNRSAVARATRTDALTLLDGEGALEDRWEALNVAQQRAALAEVFERVDVLPADRRGLAFDPRRLVPVYRF